MWRCACVVWVIWADETRRDEDSKYTTATGAVRSEKKEKAKKKRKRETRGAKQRAGETRREKHAGVVSILAYRVGCAGVVGRAGDF